MTYVMPKDWVQARLGDVVTLERDTTSPQALTGRIVEHFSIPAFDDGERAAIELADGIGSNKFVVPDDAVLVSRLNPRTPRVWLPRVFTTMPAIASTEFLVLRPSPRIERRFLKYVCLSPPFLGAMQGRVTGTSSSHQRVRPEDALSIQVLLPPLPQQRVIAAVLGCLDDKIELNRRMNETLEAIARAIFKSWFVDFDPVRAKLEGRPPFGMDAATAALFPVAFEESPLGSIPKGWEVGTLKDVLAELETGGRPKGGVSSYSAGIPSIGAESIVRLGAFDYSKTKFVPQEFFDVMSKGHVKSRDVLLYKDGGRPGEFEPHVTLFGDGFPFETCAINEHVYRMRASAGYGQPLLFFWLSSDLVMEEMRVKGTGVAIPGLNSTQVRSLTTLVPPVEVAMAFDTLVEPIIARVLAGCNESRALAELRDTLLPKLLSGELRVKDAERIAELA